MKKTKEQILAKKMLKHVNILKKYHNKLANHPAFGFHDVTISVDHAIDGDVVTGRNNEDLIRTKHVLKDLWELRSSYNREMRRYKIFDKELDKCIRACSDLKSRSEE